MRLILAGIAALGTLGISAPSTQQNPLDQLRWLAGCWEQQRGTRTTVEMWMPPQGGLMIGGSRTVINNAVREYEHLRLTVQGTQVVYTAIPSRQSETSFTSTMISDTALVVENLQHDFPQRIIYRRRGADSLIARIEGPGQGGTTRGIDFPYRRAACSAG